MVATLFVKFTDSKGNHIKGDATEKHHPSWLVVNSISFKTERTSEQEGGSATRGFGKAKFQVMEFNSEFGTHSTQLMQAAASGMVYKKIEIDQCRSPQGDPSTGVLAYIKWTLHDCMIQNYSMDGDSEDIPKETWGLTYGQVECEYLFPDKTGSAMKTVNTFKWNVAEGVYAA